MKVQQPSSRHLSSTPQKPLQRANSALHFSPLNNCINLPLAQNSTLPKCYYYKENENQPIRKQVLIQEDKKPLQTPNKLPLEANITYTNSTIPASSSKPERNAPFVLRSANFNNMKSNGNYNNNGNFNNNNGNLCFDIDIMKEMQTKFKKILEENEQLKCSLIQKNSSEEQNKMNQHITFKQICDLETKHYDDTQEITKLQSQLEQFQQHNQCNLKILQETEEKHVNYLKLLDINKQNMKNLTLENINLKKNNEELIIQINSLQTKMKQDTIQLQRFEETVMKVTRDHDILKNSWNSKYSELQQSFIIEKNLHQQSEKSFKIKLQELETDLKVSEEKTNETYQILTKTQKELNSERERIQILEYKLQENEADLVNFQEIESRVSNMKQDNDSLLDLISRLRNDKDCYEKELNSRQNELEEMLQESNETKKQNEELSNELHFFKNKYEVIDKEKALLVMNNQSNKEEIIELVALNETWENKINLLITEAERLSILLKEKEVSIENITSDHINLQSGYENLLKEHHSCNEELKSVLKLKAESLQKLSDLETKWKQDQKIKEQLENDKKVIIRFYEENRLKSDKELENYRNKYNSILNELEEYRQRFDEYKSLKIDDNSIKIKFQAEKSTFETEIIQLKNKLMEYEIAYNALLQKTEDLHLRNHENGNEKESLQKDFAEKMENFEKENKNIIKISEKMKNSLFEKEEKILKLEILKKKYEGQIKELKEVLQINKDEIENIYAMNNQKHTDFDTLRKNYEINSSETNNLVKENKELKKQLNKMKEDEINYKRTIDILANTSKDYKQQIDQFSGELNIKNKELIDKIDHLDKLKDNYSKTLEKIEVLETKLLNKLQQK